MLNEIDTVATLYREKANFINALISGPSFSSVHLQFLYFETKNYATKVSSFSNRAKI